LVNAVQFLYPVLHQQQCYLQMKAMRSSRNSHLDDGSKYNNHKRYGLCNPLYQKETTCIKCRIKHPRSWRISEAAQLNLSHI